MTFNAIDTANGATLMQVLGDPVTYRRCSGETVSTYAMIDENVEVFDDQGPGTAVYRTEITLLRADIGTPKRGDRIIDADGENYTVQDWLRDQSDKVEIRVSVK